MGRSFAAILGGVMFGAGLGFSGIANPVVINNFLDLASPDLDFTLIILFCVALATTTMTYQFILRSRPEPVLDDCFHLPDRTDIDGELVGGAVLFGLGWSLSGLCVGPALAAGVGSYAIALPYLGAVAVGSLGAELFLGKKKDAG